MFTPLGFSGLLLGLPGYGDAAPVVDLNGAGGGINASGTFTEGDSATTFLTSATVTDADDTDLASITIVGTNGFGEDTINDIVSWGAVTFPSNADKTANVVAGATTIQVAFTTATKTFTCTKSGGGEIPKADAQSFIRAFAYNNTATPPDTSDRVFTFVVNDGTDNSATATLTLSVQTPPTLDLGGTSGNAATIFIIDGTAAAITEGATVTNDPTTCTLTLSGFTDGDDETVTIGATSYPAATDDTGSATAGSTTFDVAFSSGVFTITKNGGGVMPAADLTTLLDAIAVANTAWPFTTGARTVAVSLNGDTAKTATITEYIAELPRATVDTTYSLPVGGTTHTPADSAALQTAFDNAVGGDVIVLTAGTKYSGYFTLAPHTGSDPIYIISSALASLPSAGTRVTPLDAADMPIIAAPSYINPAITIEKGVNNLRFVGIEIASDYAVRTNAHYGVVRVGYGGASSSVADNIIFDRCYMHGTRTGNIRDGFVVYEVSNFALIDSYVSEVHAVNYESHGVQIYIAIGPTKIHNNYIEAAGINLFIGDSTLTTIPQDIEVTNNHLFKPLNWYESHPEYAGIDWLAKNLFESKGSIRMLVEGNKMENSWPDSQVGYAILITPRGGDINDTTIRNNHIKEYVHGITVNDSEQEIHRFDMLNNVFDDPGTLTTNGLWAALTGTNVTNSRWRIMHNTSISASGNSCCSFNGPQATTDQVNSLEFRDNLLDHGLYGVFGTGTGVGFASVDRFVNQYSFRNNVLISGSAYAASYANQTNFTGFQLPANRAAVGFVDDSFPDLAAFALDVGSSYLGDATDGTDPGCDIDALTTALGAYDYDANITAPTIELGGDGIASYAADYSSGDLDIAPDAVVWDYGERAMTTLTLVVGGVVDGAAEVLTIGGTAFPLNADSSTTGTANSQTFDIAYTTATQTFVITLNGGGNPKLPSVEALIQGMSYNNSAGTGGDRTFTFTASDGTHTGTAAVSTITVLQTLVDVKLNFRQTSGYVTDNSGEAYVIGDVYPTTRGGFTFGWDNLTNVNARDRNASLDPRLAGTHLTSNASRKFYVDLEPGVYDVHIACGDASFSQSGGVQIFDNDGNSLLTVTDATIGAQEYLDAAGTTHTTAANWIANEVSAAITVPTLSTQRIYLALPAGVTNLMVAHIRFDQTS